ncbi:hypothetical protein SOVF_139920, partial [Spinacia oleracea]
MGRPRKQASKSSNGAKQKDNVIVTKPVTRAQQPSSPLEDVDEISESPKTNPDIETLLAEQILSPSTALKDLQRQSQVRTEFNAWINGLSA